MIEDSWSHFSLKFTIRDVTIEEGYPKIIANSIKQYAIAVMYPESIREEPNNLTLAKDVVLAAMTSQTAYDMSAAKNMTLKQVFDPTVTTVAPVITTSAPPTEVPTPAPTTGEPSTDATSSEVLVVTTTNQPSGGTSSPQKDDSDKTKIIAIAVGAGGGGLILLIAIIVAVTCCRIHEKYV